MSAVAQIRINKTPEIIDILSFLKEQYYGLSESEIIKVVLSNVYSLSQKKVEIKTMEYEDLSIENKKLYDEVDNIPVSKLYNI